MLNDGGKCATQTGQIHNGGVGNSVDRKQRQMQDINAAQMDNGGGQQIQVNLVLQAVPSAGHWMSPPCMFSCPIKSPCNENYCLFCKR